MLLCQLSRIKHSSNYPVLTDASCGNIVIAAAAAAAAAVAVAVAAAVAVAVAVVVVVAAVVIPVRQAFHKSIYHGE